MDEPHRPDPDALLAAIKKSEDHERAGRLTIFFGMAAGVGKTYAMLNAAQERLREKVDVIVGTVDTHGRAETEALLAGLPIIPRKKIEYRGVILEEMDIDAVQSRKPQLALVDELAHTNAPGSRHPKRYQDVIELLDAKIDVYTTLNVQHVESRKEAVESVAGITVRESVPDSLLERASQIILIDITPAELLKRLAEGKVYLGDKAEAAAENFFKEDRLTALREIALRLTAEKVDSDLHDLIAARGGTEAWKPTERLMVAVSHSPYSEGLIRATRRIAFSLDAPWIAVHVDTGESLGAEDRATLSKNLRLVLELGGELVTTSDTDIAGALRRVAEQRHVTQLVVGRPTWRWRHLFVGGTILDRLARKYTGCDILVLHSDSATKRSRGRKASDITERYSVKSHAIAIGTIVAVALLNSLMLPLIGYKAAGFVFLLSVLVLSLFSTFGAVTVAAILSALIWNFFFIQPFGTFYISDPEDVMMVCSYLVAALVTGSLTHRIRTRQRLIRKREERTNLLHDLAKSLVGRSRIDEAVAVVSGHLHSLLQGDIDLLTVDDKGALSRQPVLDSVWLKTDQEFAVAFWAHENNKAAGWSTQTIPLSSALYLPIQAGSGTSLGVLAFRPAHDLRLTQDEENLLSAIAHNFALYLERERLRSQALQAEKLRESERLLQTVIDSVSHELRTPLTAIAGTASALAGRDIVETPNRREQLVTELLTMIERLNRVVGNLLDMSRLSAGSMTLQKEWHDIRDVISAALSTTQHEMRDREVILQLDEHLPLIRLDFRLFEQALANILANAATHTLPRTRVEISCQAVEERLRLIVSDNGPGISEEAMAHVFTKFYRAPGSPPGGVGLGLAITKAIIEAHEGTISAANRPKGGASFVVTLPVEPQPEIPSEVEKE